MRCLASCGQFVVVAFFLVFLGKIERDAGKRESFSSWNKWFATLFCDNSRKQMKKTSQKEKNKSEKIWSISSIWWQPSLSSKCGDCISNEEYDKSNMIGINTLLCTNISIIIIMIVILIRLPHAPDRKRLLDWFNYTNSRPLLAGEAMFHFLGRVLQ